MAARQAEAVAVLDQGARERPHAGSARPRRVLNVGCGSSDSDSLPAMFRHGAAWSEVRLDIDPRVAPDILCSIIDMSGAVESASYDALWSSHTIEHLHDHEVTLALSEFRRVLKDTGFALIRCPDVEAVLEAVRRDGLETVAYVSPAGPVTPLDMLYGFRPSIARGNSFMAHKTCFTDLRLGRMLIEAGFTEVRTKRVQFDLWALAIADARSTRPIVADLARAGLVFKDA